MGSLLKYLPTAAFLSSTFRQRVRSDPPCDPTFRSTFRSNFRLSTTPNAQAHNRKDPLLSPYIRKRKKRGIQSFRCQFQPLKKKKSTTTNKQTTTNNNEQ